LILACFAGFCGQFDATEIFRADFGDFRIGKRSRQNGAAFFRCATMRCTVRFKSLGGLAFDTRDSDILSL
jgi:hypothetical protein